MKRDQTYQVVSPSAVTVEFPNGNVVSYPTGFMFKANPTTPAVTRLLRLNLIRQVTPREVPSFRVDTTSHAVKATPVAPPLSPLQVATQVTKTTIKPTGGEE
ncbi:MAG: hypothetical protein AB7L09_03350 [Nitrospira sp.]